MLFGAFIAQPRLMRRQRGERAAAFCAKQEIIRPPPGSTPEQSRRWSLPQIRKIASAMRGRMGGIGPSGATAGAAAVAAAGAPVAGAGGLRSVAATAF